MVDFGRTAMAETLDTLARKIDTLGASVVKRSLSNARTPNSSPSVSSRR
jgi:hypothetical protein